ncbi:Translation elongation factor Ts [Planctomycetales bacterium 10988]|nr:Translation elongation factor Ts [Planctomycetales bacterium 10988]
MAEITAKSVKSLRDKTQLPMMECKKALVEAGGDEAKAIEWLRKQGEKFIGKRQDRETTEGFIAAYADVDAGCGALVELLCESGPVAGNEEFRQLARDMAELVAKNPEIKTVDELKNLPALKEGAGTIKDQLENLTNRIREVFNVPRILRIDGPCGCYAHHTGTTGVLVEVEGGDQVAANEIAMHVAAMNPEVVTKEDLDQELVKKEREILTVAARQEGKPENIIEKMVEGRLRNFYSERVLMEQPFIKDEKGKTTVAQHAKKAGIKIKQIVNWKLGSGDSSS